MRPARLISGDRLAVVLVAHGSRDPRAAAATEALARAVRRAHPGWAVHAAYLDHAGPRPLDVLAALPGHRVVLVPLLLTSAYHGRVDIPAVLEAAADLPLTVTLAGVLGPQPTPPVPAQQAPAATAPPVPAEQAAAAPTQFVPAEQAAAALASSLRVQDAPVAPAPFLPAQQDEAAPVPFVAGQRAPAAPAAFVPVQPAVSAPASFVAAQRAPVGPAGRVPVELIDGLVRRLPGDGLDAVVLAAAGTRDAAARATVGWAADALSGRLGLPCTVAYASASPPAVADAVDRLRAAGARRVGVSAYFLAPGFLYDLAARSAWAAGAVAVADPLGDAPELVRLVAARVQAVATRALAAA